MRGTFTGMLLSKKVCVQVRLRDSVLLGEGKPAGVNAACHGG